VKLQSTNGFTYQIDEDDLSVAQSRKWCVHTPKKGKYKYVVSVDRKGPPPTMKYIHRIIAGAKPGDLVDHISGDTLDNRRSNLRISNQRLNQGNQRRIRGVVPFKGVTFERGKYRSRIRSGGKKLNLGSYNTPEEAAQAYAVAAKKIFGDHAFTNFDSMKEAA
jgi:hypothetical protein